MDQCHTGYLSQSTVSHSLYSNQQSSPLTYSNPQDYNHVDSKQEDSSKKRFSSYLKFHLGGK